MNKRVNFEDNIYILLARIRMVRDLLTLDTDPRLFLEKTVDDLEFIDTTLNILLQDISENQRLIERKEFLNHLSELDLQFEQTLSDILSGGRTISAGGSPAVKDKLTILRIHSLERRKTTVNTGSAVESRNEGPLVSSDELNELLKAF